MNPSLHPYHQATNLKFIKYSPVFTSALQHQSRLYSSPASMYPPETNTHFKIKTRPRHGGQQPHHQAHDLPHIPNHQPHYPSQFQNQEEGNDAPHLPLRQDQQQHPQQYPNPNDQEMHHHQLPPQHGYQHNDNQKLHSDPRHHNNSAAEHIPNNQHQQHHPKYTHSDQHRHGRQHKPQGPRVPLPRKTSPFSWVIAFCCTIFWVLVILAGLIVLIIYLIYHPQTPHFHISNFTLNSLYLDNGNLLNADIHILANFNNSNRKATIDFSYLTIDLYYGKTRISTQYIEPFFESNSVTTFVDIHMVTSQLHLPFREIVRLAAQVQNNRLQFELRGTFQTRSNLGSLMHYSYWLHSHCTAVVTNPPNGIMLWQKCSSKR